MVEKSKASPRRVSDSPEVMRQWDRESNVNAPENVLLSSKKQYSFRCPTHGTQFTLGLHLLLKGSTGCHPCRGHAGELQLRNPSIEKHYSGNNDVPFLYAPATRQRALFLCGECGAEFSAETREMAKLTGHPLCGATHGNSLGEILDELNLALVEESHGDSERYLLRERRVNDQKLHLRCPAGHEILTTGRLLRNCATTEEVCCKNGRVRRRLSLEHPQLEGLYGADNRVPFHKVFYTPGDRFTWRKSYYIKIAPVGAMLGTNPWRKGAMEIVESGFNDLASIYGEVAATLHGEVDATTIHCYSQEELRWSCKRHINHPYVMKVADRTKAGRGCPYCANRLLLPGFNDAETRYPGAMARLDETGRALARTVFPSSGIEATWRCLERPHHPPYEKSFKDVLIAGHQCPDCAQMGVSAMERAFGDALEAASGIVLERNNRSALGGRRELDLYCPERKVAIEFNGEYWHSSERAGKVDAWKVAECQRRGISLLVITDREWLEGPQTALSRALEHLLGECW